MHATLRKIVSEYGWIHSGIGLIGNLAFIMGSTLFLPQFEPWRTTGVHLFIIGSSLMLVRALGDLLVKWYDRDRS